VSGDPAWLAPALARLDQDEIAATAAELVAVPSVGGTPGERLCLDRVAAWLDDHGVATETWTVPAPALPAPAGWSSELVREEVPVLTATVGARGGPGLLVDAHLDVVATDQPGWSTDPFTARRDGDWLVGRGTADTKGGLAAAMHVAAALAAVDGDLPGHLVLAPVVGEEDGGAGTLALLARPWSVSAAVVVEPTDLRVAVASAGALRFRIHVPGVTAHGSVRHRGVSAIEKGWAVHRALLDLERARAERLEHPLVAAEPGAATPWPVCIGRIEGGTQPCDVADHLVLDGRLGVAPHEDPAAARAELEEAVARVGTTDPWLALHPPRVHWVGAQWWPAQTPVDDPVAMAFTTTAGGEPVAVPYGCDAGLLRHLAGLPTVVVGPGEVARAHAAEERVRVGDLARFAEVLLGSTARWWSLRA
jgi:acetylornithine deacetylase